MSCSTTDQTAATDDTPRIDAERLWTRFMAMAEIGRRGDTGVDRAAFSPDATAGAQVLMSALLRLSSS